MQPSHLIRNPSSYCFRLIVPSDLRPIVDRYELRYSLRTGCINEAKPIAILLAGRIHQLFRKLRNSPSQADTPDSIVIQSTILEYVREALGVHSKPRMRQYAPVSDTRNTDTLKAVIKSYVEENSSTNWTERTARDYTGCLRVLAEYFGEGFPLKSMNYERMRQYKEFLLRFPANFYKSPTFEGVTVATPGFTPGGGLHANNVSGKIVTFSINKTFRLTTTTLTPTA